MVSFRTRGGKNTPARERQQWFCTRGGANGGGRGSLCNGEGENADTKGRGGGAEGIDKGGDG